jgi:hypothetical protein
LSFFSPKAPPCHHHERTPSTRKRKSLFQPRIPGKSIKAGFLMHWRWLSL